MKMLKVYLTLFVLAAAVFAESVRETETWVPSNDEEQVSSGDFIFDNGHTPDEDKSDDDDDYGDMSGSGDDDDDDDDDYDALENNYEFNNNIPDSEPPVKPTQDELSAVKVNEIGHLPNVQLSHAGEQNIFNKKEVLAAVIAGGAVGLLFAVLLILLLVYRMKKKDEGSYDLGKKPIYKKAPTAEIYA